MALFGKQMQPTQPMTDAEQMAQIMQGNLSGQLSGGDKLLALSSLLRSVSRGRTQTPDQVFQNIQQQKLQEVQGRLQIEDFRKKAEQQAQLGALKAQYVASAPNAQAARELQLMNDQDFSAFLRERNKPSEREYAATSAEREAVSLGLKPGSDAYKAYITQRYSQPQYMQTPQGTAQIPGMGISYQEYTDPDTKEPKRAIIIGGKAYTI